MWHESYEQSIASKKRAVSQGKMKSSNPDVLKLMFILYSFPATKDWMGMLSTTQNPLTSMAMFETFAFLLWRAYH